MKRVYTVDFVRWEYPYRLNKTNAGKFTKTFKSLDEFVMFIYKTTHSNFRVAGAMSKYMNQREFDIFRQKLYALEQKDRDEQNKNN